MDDDTEISVVVTASTAGLTGPLAQASTSARAAFDGMRISAQDFSKALNAAGGDLRKTTVDIAATATVAKAAAPELASLGHGASGVTRELIVLGGEAMRGNFTRIPGSLLVLTNRMNLLSLATLAPAVGIAAVAIGLGALAVSAIESENSLERLQVAFQFNGLDASREQIENLRETIHSLPGATRKDAEDVVRGFATMSNNSLPLVKSLTNSVGIYARVTGLSAKEAGQALRNSFNEPLTSGEKLFSTLKIVSEALREEYEAAQRSGNANVASAAMTDAQTEAFVRAIPAMAENQTAWDYSIKNFIAYTDQLLGVIQIEDVHTRLLRESTAAFLAQADASRQSTAAMRSTPMLPGDLLRTGVEAGAKENPQRKQLEDTRGDIGKITAALAVAKSIGDGVRLKQLNEDLAAAKEKLENLTSGSLSSRQSAALESILVKVTANAKTTEELERSKAQATVTFWTQAASEITGTDAKAATERNAALAKANEARLQLTSLSVRTEAALIKKTAREEWEDYSASMRDAIADSKGNFDQQLTIARNWVARGKELFGEHVHNYQAAVQELDRIDNERTANIKRTTEQQASIQRNLADARADLDKIGEKSNAGEFKPSIGLVFDDSSLEAEVGAQIDKLKAALDEKLAGLQASMKGKLDIGDVVGATADYKQATAALLNFTNQTTALTNQATQAVAASWEKITGPIDNALGSVVDAALSGNQSIAAAAQRAASQMVASWAKSLLKSAGDWLLSEAQKTVATESGEMARSAIQQQGAGQEVAQMAITLAKGVTTEAAKTGATVAGVAVRTSATATGAATGAAAETAAASQSIFKNASKAAAAVYADVADATGPFGFILAPIAAAAAFVGVMAFDSFDKGSWDLPHDQMAMVHKGEMIIPAAQAGGMRDMLGGSWSPRAAGFPALGDLTGSRTSVSNQSSQSSQFNLTHNPTINAGGGKSGDIARALKSSSNDLHATLQAWHGNGSLTLPGRKVWR